MGKGVWAIFVAEQWRVENDRLIPAIQGTCACDGQLNPDTTLTFKIILGGRQQIWRNEGRKNSWCNRITSPPLCTREHWRRDRLTYQHVAATMWLVTPGQGTSEQFFFSSHASCGRRRGNAELQCFLPTSYLESELKWLQQPQPSHSTHWCKTKV